MSQTEVLLTARSQTTPASTRQRRKLADAILRPFQQYKLLAWLLGSTVLVAFLLGVFLYIAFGHMIGTLASDTGTGNYYGELIGVQLINLFRYGGALFTLYAILLTAVCITYTHRVVGPLVPFDRHVDALNQGDYSHRIQLRKNDLPLMAEHAEKLNSLAETLETRHTSSQQ